jgi:2-amino-4-hydroxy-6-hydroxymethyldihydropteridine diphosphokinase
LTWVALSLGSNIEPEVNIRSCLDALLLKFSDLSLSSVFESEAIGFSGDNFLNMAVAFETDEPLQTLITTIKKIEDDCGRDRSQPRFSGRTLDIDVLIYGDKSGTHSGIELPRPEITENAFVLWPLSQLAAKRSHPALQQSYKELWQNFDKASQKLWPIDFEWHGRLISKKLSQ